MRQRLVRRLYRETNADLERACLVAGTGRSGTTWLGEWIATELGARLMFEPFHSELVADFSRFEYFHYQRPEEENEPLRAFAERVFSGRIRHSWIDRQVEVLRPARRVVKEIRANLFLAWLRRRFPRVPSFLLVRHPCAVVASRLQLGWATDADLAPLFRQPKLRDDFLAPHLGWIERLSAPEEKHALLWCISNAVPLTQLAPGEIELVHYEDLLMAPARELARVCRALGHTPRPGVASAQRESMTTVREGAVESPIERATRWRRELTPAQSEKVLEVVRRFGLGSLYGEDGLPINDAHAPRDANGVPAPARS